MQSISTNSVTISTNKLMSLVIHFFKRSYNLFNQVYNEEFKISVYTKDENEKFTNGDFILQKMFENYITKYFNSIAIIGEEDTSKNTVTESEYFSVEESDAINFDIIKQSDIPDNFTELSSEDLAFYIDPIDATEQFIKRNFAPVTSLVGLTFKSVPIIGFMYFPKYKGIENNSQIFFNIPSRGIFSLNTHTDEISSVPVTKLDADKWTFVSSLTKTTDNMKNIFSSFDNSSIILIPGLGEKALECILNDHFYISSSGKLGLWDICAGHAMIKEVGGGIFYFDGIEISYPKVVSSRFVGQCCMITSSSERVPKFIEVLKEKNLTMNI